jgi:hypothetical protein
MSRGRQSTTRTRTRHVVSSCTVRAASAASVKEQLSGTSHLVRASREAHGASTATSSSLAGRGTAWATCRGAARATGAAGATGAARTTDPAARGRGTSRSGLGLGGLALRDGDGLRMTGLTSGGLGCGGLGSGALGSGDSADGMGGAVGAGMSRRRTSTRPTRRSPLSEAPCAPASRCACASSSSRAAASASSSCSPSMASMRAVSCAARASRRASLLLRRHRQCCRPARHLSWPSPKQVLHLLDVLVLILAD